MRGLMQDRPLAIPHIFHRAERHFGHKRIITGTPRGEVSLDYAQWAVRVRRLAAVLDELGVPEDGRVATFGWNTQRHLELYFAAPCTGRVLHTLNIRLFPDQLAYIVENADDQVMFVDRSLLPVLWPQVDRLPSVRHFVVMDDGADAEIPADPRVRDYEELLASVEPFGGTFHIDDEYTAAGMCYTSGTTGNPKGVVYSHRSTVLHSLLIMTSAAQALSERDVMFPLVPMFHVNAWGLPYAGVFAGAQLVLPGPDMRPDSLLETMQRHRVTLTAGVPTVFMGMVPKLAEFDLSSLRSVTCGGSAVPPALSKAWKDAIGLPLTHAWGMTETSPLASVSHLASVHDDLDEDGKDLVRASQGTAAPLVELRIASPETGEELPWDDTATGELQAAGPTVAAAYYRDDDTSAFTDDGYLRTGDVAAVNSLGYLRLVDRTKDLVKSGGEWISSVELENEIMAHPDVAEAAVIAVAHPRWQERPLAVVVPEPNTKPGKDDIIDHLRPRVAKWWLPDDVVFIDEMPKTGTGKFAKKVLRERFAGYVLPGAD